jgi:hypothetical protein
MKLLFYLFLLIILRVNVFGQDDLRIPDNIYISYFVKDGKLTPTNIIIGTSMINGVRSVDLSGIGWHEYLKSDVGKSFFITEEHGKEFNRLEIDNRLSVNGTFYHIEEMPTSNEVYIGYKFNTPAVFLDKQDLDLLPDLYKVDYPKIFQQINKTVPQIVRTDKFDFIAFKDIKFDSIVIGLNDNKLLNFDLVKDGQVITSFIKIK